MLPWYHFLYFFCSRNHSKALWEKEGYIKLMLVSVWTSQVIQAMRCKTCMHSSCRSQELIALSEVRHAWKWVKTSRELCPCTLYLGCVLPWQSFRVIYWILHMPGHLHHLQHKTLLRKEDGHLDNLCQSVWSRNHYWGRTHRKLRFWHLCQQEQSQLVLCPEP